MTPTDTIFEKDFDFIIKQTQHDKYPVKHLPLKFLRSEHPEDYIVPQTFRPLVFVSRCWGACPVKIVQERSEGKVIYEFKRLSVHFFLSSIAGLTTAVLLFFWVLNSLIDTDWPVRIFRSTRADSNWLSDNAIRGFDLIRVLNMALRASLPLGAFVVTILQWSSLNSFCEFLNGWTKFFRDFDFAFSSHYSLKFNLAVKRNLFSVVWIIPIVALMFVLAPINFLPIDNVIISRILVYGQMMCVVGARAIFYVKDFLCLQTIRMAYQELLNGIKAEYGKYKKTISRDQVRAWMDMVTFIRKQTGRFEDYMGVPNLWSIFEVFTSVLLILAIAVFLFMNNMLFSGVSGNFFPYALICTSFYLMSLYWKTYQAEEIATMEEAIAEEIIEMETADDECETRLEMKLICDLIYNDPVQIKVWKMLTLNKQLLLAFFSQLASYLVVILQFTK